MRASNGCAEHTITAPLQSRAQAVLAKRYLALAQKALELAAQLLAATRNPNAGCTAPRAHAETLVQAVRLLTRRTNTLAPAAAAPPRIALTPQCWLLRPSQARAHTRKPQATRLHMLGAPHSS